MCEQNEQDFKSLFSAVEEISALKECINIPVIHVKGELRQWILDQYDLYKENGTWEKSGSCSRYLEVARPQIKKTKDGEVRLTISPYGIVRTPVKAKNLMRVPWRIAVEPMVEESSKGS